MTDAAVRVLIVDDDDLMRAGLRGVLSSDHGGSMSSARPATGATRSIARGSSSRTSS